MASLPALKSSISLVQVSVVLLSGMLEDSVMKPANSLEISRVEGDNGQASSVEADSPVCWG